MLRQLQRTLFFCFLIAFTTITHAENSFEQYENSGRLQQLLLKNQTSDIPPNIDPDAFVFRSLLSDFGTFLNGEPRVRNTVVPFGRSLQAHYADRTNPRHIGVILGANRFEPAKGYIGYSPKKEQLEIIALNSTTGEYEVLVGDGFSPGSQSVSLINPGNLCLKCHQNNNAPLLSHLPWNEIVNLDDPFVPEESNDYVVWRKENGLKKIPMNIGGNTIGAEIKMSNRFVQTRRICNSLCNGDQSCFRALLLTAVLSIDLDYKESPLSQGEKLKLKTQLNQFVYQSFENIWPEDGFEFPSPVIPDRDPKTEVSRAYIYDIDSESAKVLADLVSEDIGDSSTSFYVKEAMERGENINYHIDLSRFISNPQWAAFAMPYYTAVPTEESLQLLDPRTARPKVGAIPLHKAGEILSQFSMSCFNLKKEDLMQFRDIPLERRISGVLFGENIESHIKAPESLTNSELKSSLLIDFERPVDQRIYSLFLNESNPPVRSHLEDSVPTSSQPAITWEEINSMSEPGFTRAEATEFFDNYCYSCHSGGMDLVPELPLEDHSRMKSIFDGAVLWQIRNRSMPDNQTFGKDIFPMPTDRERKFILKYLQNL